MTYKKLSIYLISLVWLSNGLFCKVLNYVPRHQEIVKEILCLDNPSTYIVTKLIGFSEVLMAIWIISRIKSKINAILQIIIILTMNILEFTVVPNLLLWGKWNSVFALLFCVFIYFNEFILNKEKC